MQAVVYRLKNKLSWMVTKLRFINGGEDITTWVSAMQAVHTLLVKATENSDLLECFDSKSDQAKKQPLKEQPTRRKKLTLTTKLGIKTFGDEPPVGTLLKGCRNARTSHIKVNTSTEEITEKGPERRRRTVVKGKRTGCLMSETMKIEQIDIRRTYPKSVAKQTRTTGEMELDNLSAIGATTGRMDGQEIESNVVKENDAEGEGTKLNMEEKLLWEGIRREIKVEKEPVEWSKRWEYDRAANFDRLLTETALQLQISGGNKIDIRWKIRRHIAEKMRSFGFRLGFSI